jgi:hypothetical protein
VKINGIIENSSAKASLENGKENAAEAKTQAAAKMPARRRGSQYLPKIMPGGS